MTARIGFELLKVCCCCCCCFFGGEGGGGFPKNRQPGKLPFTFFNRVIFTLPIAKKIQTFD